MFQKTALACLATVCLAFSLAAQDAPKPTPDAPAPGASSAPTATPSPTPGAKPAATAAPAKVSYAFTQTIASDTNNGLMASSGIYNSFKSSIGSRTNFKAQIDFDLGSGLKLTPWVQVRLDILADPTSSAGAIKANYRNRFYAGLNFYLPIDKAFNIGINAEYRYANYIKSATPTASQVMVPQNRLTPFLVFSGKIAGLYYSLGTDLPYYFTDNSQGANNTSMLELEGNYTLGYSFTVDDKTSLKIEAFEYIDSYNILANPTVSTYPANLSDAVVASPAGFSCGPAFASELRARVILSAAGGDIAPFIGFLKSTQMIYLSGPAIITTAVDVMGLTLGTDLKIGGNASLNITADIGVDAASPLSAQPWVTEISASVSIKG